MTRRKMASMWKKLSVTHKTRGNIENPHRIVWINLLVREFCAQSQFWSILFRFRFFMTSYKMKYSWFDLESRKYWWFSCERYVYGFIYLIFFLNYNKLGDLLSGLLQLIWDFPPFLLAFIFPLEEEPQCIIFLWERLFDFFVGMMSGQAQEQMGWEQE